MPKYIFLVLSLCLLTGCSLLSPVKGPEHTYLLTAIGNPCTYSQSHLTLFVAPIDSYPVYNTTQIAYTVKPYQISYFSKNAWADTPAQMLQPLLIQTLQNTHFFHAVTILPTHYDYALNVQLLELKQNFLVQPNVVELKLRAQLIRAVSNDIVATKVICVTRIAPCRNPYSGVVAANEATAEALTELALFTVRVL